MCAVWSSISLDHRDSSRFIIINIEINYHVEIFFYILIDIKNECITSIVKHLRSVALLDRCCRVPFGCKVGETFWRWQFCDMKNATKYLVVGSPGVLMTRQNISGCAVKEYKLYSLYLE